MATLAATDLPRTSAGHDCTEIDNLMSRLDCPHGRVVAGSRLFGESPAHAGFSPSQNPAVCSTAPPAPPGGSKSPRSLSLPLASHKGLPGNSRCVDSLISRSQADAAGSFFGRTELIVSSAAGPSAIIFDSLWRAEGRGSRVEGAKCPRGEFWLWTLDLRLWPLLRLWIVDPRLWALRRLPTLDSRFSTASRRPGIPAVAPRTYAAASGTSGRLGRVLRHLRSARPPHDRRLPCPRRRRRRLRPRGLDRDRGKADPLQVRRAPRSLRGLAQHCRPADGLPIHPPRSSSDTPANRQEPGEHGLPAHAGSGNKHAARRTLSGGPRGTPRVPHERLEHGLSGADPSDGRRPDLNPDRQAPWPDPWPCPRLAPPYCGEIPPLPRHAAGPGGRVKFEVSIDT